MLSALSASHDFTVLFLLSSAPHLFGLEATYMDVSLSPGTYLLEYVFPASTRVLSGGVPFYTPSLPQEGLGPAGLLEAVCLAVAPWFGAS